MEKSYKVTVIARRLECEFTSTGPVQREVERVQHDPIMLESLSTTYGDTTRSFLYELLVDPHRQWLHKSTSPQYSWSAVADSLRKARVMDDIIWITLPYEVVDFGTIMKTATSDEVAKLFAMNSVKNVCTNKKLYWTELFVSIGEYAYKPIVRDDLKKLLCDDNDFLIRTGNTVLVCPKDDQDPALIAYNNSVEHYKAQGITPPKDLRRWYNLCGSKGIGRYLKAIFDHPNQIQQRYIEYTGDQYQNCSFYRYEALNAKIIKENVNDAKHKIYVLTDLGVCLLKRYHII